MNRFTQFNYDQFGNLASSSPMPNSGYQALSYSASHDRYGNRWSEAVGNTPSGSGPNQSLTFNTANNQIQGMGYDAVGNLVNDTVHTYQHDAENNLISIDGGSTASYAYTALNERDKVVTSAGIDRIGFDIRGRRSTTWQDGNVYVKADQYYSDGGPVAFFSVADNLIHFEHGDGVGTERMRTDNAGNVQSTFTSLPFGEPSTSSGSDLDPAHFAGLDQDGTSGLGLHHAMFREYNSTQGRWMSPDPYAGSYALRDPQSLNRYSYVGNNPLALTDTTGMDYCMASDGSVISDDGDDSLNYEEGCITSPGGGGSGNVWVVETPPANIADVNADPSSPPISGTFTFSMSQQQFNQMMTSSGFQFSPVDTSSNPFHKGSQYRSSQRSCSIHATIDPDSGQNGQPITGTYHTDYVNPLNQAGTGLAWSTTGHFLFDVIPDSLPTLFNEYSPLHFMNGQSWCAGTGSY